MATIRSIGQLKEIVSKKMAEDVALIFNVTEKSLFNMLNNVIQERVYEAYDPVYYRRTYTLKNAITSETGYGKYSTTSSVIATRVYIDYNKLNYRNGKKDIPNRLDTDRVKRREDRWRSGKQSCGEGL